MTPSYPKPEPRQKPKPKRMNPVSDSRRDENALRAELRPHWFRREGVCEVPMRHQVDRCYGGITIHEPWSRGRGGPIDDPRNWRTLCARHNEQVSQNETWMQWAIAEGLLFHEREGREWLESGGRFPRMSKEQAIEEIRRW